MQIYLVRHTLPDIGAGICYGQSDIDLAASFLHDLGKITEKLQGVERSVWYTSPSLRCVRLVEAIYTGDAIKDKRLMELDFGDWELKSWETIPRDAMDHWAQNYVTQAPPNGETFHQLHHRAVKFLQEVSADPTDKSIIVVTHAGVIRALLAEVLGLSFKHIFRIHIDYGSVTQLLVEASEMQVGYVNR